MTCIYAPYSLAFQDIVPEGLNILDTIINLIFLLDIFVNLFSAYEDDDYVVITSFKVIFDNLIIL